jgi:hypothetical protein
MDKMKDWLKRVPWPRVLGGIVVLGEAAKITQETIQQGGVPTELHDWIMLLGGAGIAASKQYNHTNATVKPSATAQPAPKVEAK